MGKKYLKRIYNRASGQLEYYLDVEYSTRYWDRHWSNRSLAQEISKAGKKDLEKLVKKYVTPGAKILEAGCGNGHLVYLLQQKGYDTYGVDFASETVKKLNICFPDLKVSYGDLNKLSYTNAYFDAYISLGVIEHQRGGYDSIVKEALRIVKPGAYLFVSFPYMSFLRRLKAYAHLYDEESKDAEGLSFYQYALTLNGFLDKCRAFDIDIVKIYRASGLKGFKDEVSCGRNIMQKLFDYNGRNSILIGCRAVLTRIFNIFAAHTVMVVIKKRNS